MDVIREGSHNLDHSICVIIKKEDNYYIGLRVTGVVRGVLISLSPGGIGSSLGARLTGRARPLPVGGSHRQFPHVLVRMENDYVHFGHVETHQSDRGAQTDCQAHGRYLNLKFADYYYHC